MANKAQSIKATRTSAAPNQYGSYAYTVDASSIETVKAMVEQGVEGFYQPEGEDGPTVLFSRNRVGSLNKLTTLQVTTRKSKTDERVFVNIVDNSIDKIADAGHMYQQASRFGEGFAAIVGNKAVEALFAGKPAAATPAPAKAAVAAAETVEAEAEQPAENVELGATADTPA